jgi:modulator of FtsH protease HflK
MSFDDNPWRKKNKENSFDLGKFIDDLFKNFAGNGSKPSKGKTPPKKTIIISALFLGILVWMASGFYKLLPYEQALVLRFGKWVRTDNEGLNYHLPYPVEIVRKVPTGTIHRMDIGVPSGTEAYPSIEEHIMLTGDENILHIGMSLSWQIKDLQQFVLISQNPIDTLHVTSASVLREIVGQTQTAPIISRSGWSDINQQVQSRLQVLVDKYQIGIRIVNVELHTALPPQPVADSFTEVQRAKTFQEKVVNEAYAYANDKIPRARGEKEKIIQAATASATETINLAKGKSERFSAIYAEYKRNPELNKKRMYYEVLTEILSNNKTKQIFDASLLKGGILPHFNLNDTPKSGKGKK